MFDKSRVKADFEKSAEKYDAHAQLQLQVATEVFRCAEESFPAKATVLDAGCGTGFIAELSKSTGWQLTQLDLALEMCRLAQGRGEGVVNGDIDALPFPDSCFDGITSSLVFQWINNASHAFSELARVLKPGGKLSLATFGPTTLGELKAVFEQLDSHGHLTEFSTQEALLEAARAGGFADVRITSETVTQHFPDARVLMKKIKVIGASNKNVNRRKTLSSRELFEELEQNYQVLYNTPKGLPATWEILYLTATKA